MKNFTKGLSQAWLMLIVLFTFVNSPTDEDNEKGTVRLIKRVSKGSELDMVVESPNGNPDHKCRVSIFNMSSYKEVFKWFANAYEAAKYIAEGHAANELYQSYMRVCRENGPFSFELQPYFAMITAGDNREFIYVDAVNASDATEQIKVKIVELLGPNDTGKVDVKMRNKTDAKLFASYIMAN